MEVTVRNGFRTAQSVYELSWADGLPVLKELRFAPECTWVDDPKVDEVVEVTGQALRVTWQFDQYGRLYGHQVEFFGVDPEAFDRPVPQKQGVALYYLDKRPSSRIECPVEIRSMRDYLDACLRDQVMQFTATSWTEMPYSWGDQPAACFWRIGEDGTLEIEKGCGNRTPFLGADGEVYRPHQVN